MDQTARNESISTGRQFFHRVFTRHRRLSFLSVFCMVLSGLLNGIGILLLIPMLNAVGLDGDHSVPGRAAATTGLTEWLGVRLNLPTVLSFFVVLSVMHAMLIRWQSILNAQLKEDVVHSLRIDLYSAINRSTWMFFVSRQSSDVTHALTDNLKRVTAGTVQGLRVLSTLLVAVAQVGATFLISPLLSLATIGAGAILWPFLSRQSRTVATTGRELTSINRAFFGSLANYLSGMKEAKSLGAEELSIAVFAEKSAEIRGSHLQMTRAVANTAAIYSIGAAVLLSCLLYVAREVLHTPIASLVALVVVFSRVLPRLRDIHSGCLHVLHMLPAFRSTMNLMEQCHQHHDGGTVCDPDSGPEPETAPVSLQKDIQFHDVSFQYRPGTDDWTLRDINLQIPVGRMTAIVGPSGAGKSTLVDLLLTLLTPTHGTILLDNQPLSEQQTSAWRSLIGYVPQETYLFHGTIRANLLWARPTATDFELREALLAASAFDFVEGLENGIDTVVGDRGVRLSGGERQRIALARALLRKPSLLILDEATSALDAENQNRIKEAVRNLRGTLTVVTVAHRLSTILDADQVIVLEAGRVVEAGSFQELSDVPGSRLSGLIRADGASAAA